MKWSAPIKEPINGDYKVITKFAWFPKRIRDGGFLSNYTTKIWLQRYQQLWEYNGFWRYRVGNESSAHIH